MVTYAAENAECLIVILCDVLPVNDFWPPWGEKLDRSRYLLLCEIFEFPNDWVAILVGMF